MPGKKIALDIRLLMGRQWIRLVEPIAADLKDAYIDKYGISKPNPDAEADAHICAHSRVWQQFLAVAERRMDGYELYAYLKDGVGHTAHDGIAEADTQTKRDAIDAAPRAGSPGSSGCFNSRSNGTNPSWKPPYLEHQFACSAPWRDAEKVLTAEEYHHGHLDWFSLDIDQSANHARGRGAGRGRAADHAHVRAVDGHLRRHASPALVDVRGLEDESELRQAGYART